MNQILDVLPATIIDFSVIWTRDSPQASDVF